MFHPWPMCFSAITIFFYSQNDDKSRRNSGNSNRCIDNDSDGQNEDNSQNSTYNIYNILQQGR